MSAFSVKSPGISVFSLSIDSAALSPPVVCVCPGGEGGLFVSPPSEVFAFFPHEASIVKDKTKIRINDNIFFIINSYASQE